MGEFALIGQITARLPQGAGVALGPGDDAAVIAAPDGRTVVTTDMLIEGRHFRRDWSSARDVGRKAAAQNLADVAAMGARPTAVTVALGAPGDLEAAWVLELADGVRAECGDVGASVIGGDTVGSEAIVVAVTALGDLEGRDPVPRSGARAGDVVALCGRLGWSEAGLQLLLEGQHVPEEVVQAHRSPQVPYSAGPQAADLGATAMCDVSDGLLADLGHIAEASSVQIGVDVSALEVADPVREAARLLQADPISWVLTGGEDNALVATFPAGTVLPDAWRVIGGVETGSGVLVDSTSYAGRAGYDHFS
ncbi:thiamine-phosphate kinase [Actinobacteria bacterium YIM 96077]|uniref:Thiamine-monophosphate kinase n=2 Tax=Phytoactinopolyspora halophila TaxID=1981511 RepID=A0A329QF64_9ACTN|nr:thiamine-phosphate kinase [Actinobacteria bacterium YIM 96077]RAW10611.1 thiamine-phosphate kinase [Phytoactinopolyspora halophila]